MDIVSQDNAIGFNNSIHQASGMDSLSQSQRYHTSIPEFFNEDEIPQQMEYKQNVCTKSNVVQNASAPKVIIEGSPSKRQNKQEDPQLDSDPLSSQICENRLLSPKVIINNEANNVTKRPVSPEVFIEIPPRDVLAEYRSAEDLRNEQKFSQTSKFKKQRDRDEERSGESMSFILIEFHLTFF